MLTVCSDNFLFRECPQIPPVTLPIPQITPMMEAKKQVKKNMKIHLIKEIKPQVLNCGLTPLFNILTVFFLHQEEQLLTMDRLPDRRLPFPLSSAGAFYIPLICPDTWDHEQDYATLLHHSSNHTVHPHL